MPYTKSSMNLLRLINTLVYYKFKINSLLHQEENKTCRSIAHYNIADDYNRIYFFHIRKTAGTSLNNMICYYSSGDESLFDNLSRKRNHRLLAKNGKIYVGWNQHLIEEGNYYYAFSHIPKHFLNLPEKTFTITCLRDPAKRVISHYKMLLEEPKKNKRKLINNEYKWLGKSFSDFLDNIPRNHLLNQLYTFSSKCDIQEAYDNIIQCSYFFFTEEFNNGIANLSKVFGFNMSQMHRRKSNVEVDLTKSDLDRLMSLLKDEYLLIDRLKNHTQVGS